MITIHTDHLKKSAEVALSVSTISSAVKKFIDVHSKLPMFQLQVNLKKTLEHADLAESIKGQFTDIVLLGTGGSSLGAQVLCKLSRLEDDVRIHFFDNIDPLTFKHFWEKSRLETTLFLVVSKSGTTPETLTQAIIAVSRAETALGRQTIANNFVVITEPKPSPLKRLAEHYGFRCIDHDPGIGGRFSALSVVGLLPALLMGIPINRIMQGAQHMLDEFLAQEHTHQIAQSVDLIAHITQTQNINQIVLMTYVDQLEPLGRWFRQLWAESLGKNGVGTTPINATGTVDQHSQLQLYLDGPKDKLFTIITHPLNWVGEAVSTQISSEIGFDFMAGRTMGELMAAEQAATIQALKENRRPTRTIQISEVSPESVGGLLMQFMIETLLMADVMDVNCFDQPAVEQGKLLTRKLLKTI
jgi:glucose-6-phosphate isomerase